MSYALEEMERLIVSGLDPKQLELILLPTEKCNFRCTYCYETFGKGRMSPWVVQSLKYLISERANDLKSLHISWFGGEPTLAKDIVLDISSHARQECEGRVQFSGTITTNAFLLDRLYFEKLLSAGVRSFQITLDGDSETHDKFRTTVKKNKTFSTIWKNLLSYKSSDNQFSVMIRLHYGACDSDSMEQCLINLAETFKGDARFYVYMRARSHFGGSNDEDILLMNKSEENELFSKAREICLDKIRLICGPSDVPGICYAAKLNSFVVRADGKLGKCTLGLDDPQNMIGKLNRDGTIIFDHDSLKNWSAGLMDGNYLQLRCPRQYLPE